MLGKMAGKLLLLLVVEALCLFPQKARKSTSKTLAPPPERARHPPPRHLPLPIVFTVRTVSQGSSFPDSAEAEAFELFDLAVRAGAKYIDVEICWSAKRVFGLISKKGQTRLLRRGTIGAENWPGTALK